MRAYLPVSIYCSPDKAAGVILQVELPPTPSASLETPVTALYPLDTILSPTRTSSTKITQLTSNQSLDTMPSPARTGPTASLVTPVTSNQPLDIVSSE